MPDDTGNRDCKHFQHTNADAASQGLPPPGSDAWLAQMIRAICRQIEGIRAELGDLRSDLPPETDQLWTYEQVAKKLNCSVRHVQTLAHSGELTPIRIGRAVRFDPETVDAFIKRKAEGAA